MQTFYKLFLFLLLCNTVCYAQHGSNKFSPLPVVLFEDNFQTDTMGSFPSHWWIGHQDSSKLKKYYRVKEIMGKRALASYSAKDGDRSGLLGRIAPRIGEIDYLPRRFTIEYDLFMSGDGVTAMEYFAYGTDNLLLVDIAATKGAVSAQHPFDGSSKGKQGDWFIKLPGFDLRKWHHVALFYADLQATLYVDGKMIFITKPHRGNIRKFVLSFDGHQEYMDSVAYTNFRLATDSSSEAGKFEWLITDGAFNTHAIRFDVNKADITGESLGFIAQLAYWLKSHPDIKLQINGHTDNDGTRAANMALSQKRADVVRALLVSYGISGNRLTAKGYGDTRPAIPDNHPKAKAENRRVEFIKR